MKVIFEAHHQTPNIQIWRFLKLLSITIIFILFYIHSFFNIERYIFINELFSILGFALYFKKGIWKTKYSNNKLIFLFNLIILYLLVNLLFSILFSTAGYYEFFRTTVIIYSAFSMFVGFYLFPKILDFLKKIKYLSVLFSISTDRFSLIIPFLSFEKSNNKTSFFIFSLLLLLQYFLYGSSTQLLTLICLICLFFFSTKLEVLLRSRSVKIVVFFFALIAPILYFYLFENIYSKFIFVGYDLFGLDPDNNAYWRLMYWFKLISQLLNESPLFGIGFGSKLFENNAPELWWLVVTEKSRESDIIPFVLGPHNSIIFILARTGFVGYMLFLVFLYSLFSKLLSVFNKRQDFSFLASFILVNITMLFNVVLESPIWAVNYWVVIGLCCYYVRQESVSLTYEKQ